MLDAADSNGGAGIRRIDAGNDLDQRRLARTVLADQTMDLAAGDAPFDLIERLGAAEALADVS